ncbi:MAG: LysR family transcriptional regulator, partial [Verrucomicrobiota bacterium]
IKALETNLGCQLVDRLGKKIVLTPSGEILRSHAKTILAQMQEAHQNLVNFNQPGHGRLRIGASVAICQHILPHVLRELKESFPDYEISVTSGDAQNLIDLLNESEIDLAVTLALPNSPGNRFGFHQLFTDRLAYLMSPMHPLARKKRIAPAELADHQLIFYQRDSETYRLTESFFQHHNVSLKASMELASMAAIKEMAKIGMGIGIVAPWIALDEIELGSLVVKHTGDASMQRTWGIYLDDSRASNLPQDVFVGICRTVCDTTLLREKSLTSSKSIQSLAG